MTRPERFLAFALLLVTLGGLIVSLAALRFVIEARHAREFYHAAHTNEQQLLDKIELEQRQELANQAEAKAFRTRLLDRMAVSDLNARKLDALLAYQGIEVPSTRPAVTP